MKFEICMGVSSTGESRETFPTWILNPEIYWGISQENPGSGLTSLKCDVDFFAHKMLPFPKNSVPNPQTF